MKKFILFLLLFLNTENCLSMFNIDDKNLPQLIKKADSLSYKKQYKNALEIYNQALRLASSNKKIDDSNYINRKIGVIYYEEKDYLKAKLFFKKNIISGKISGIIADSYFNLGLVYRKEKKIDSTLWTIKKALDIYDQLENSEAKYATYYKSGIIYKQNSKYNLAIKYLLLAYDGFSRDKNIIKQASVSYRIGDIQRLMGNYSIAEKYLNESLILRLQSDDSLKISYAYNNLANLYKTQRKFDSAIVYYNKGIDYQEQRTKKKELGKMFNNLGISYFSIKEYTPASKAFKKSLYLKKIENDSLSITFTYNELALCYLKKNLPFLSRKHLDSAKLSLSKISKEQAWMRYYYLESKYYEFTKNYKKALDYQQKLYTKHKEVFSIEQSKIIQNLQEKHESSLRENQIIELKYKDTLNKTTISGQQKSIQNRNLLLLLLFLVLLFFIGTYFYVKQQQLIKLQDIENNRLRDILKGQEEIKEHISHDLHDMVSTSYEGIRLKILAFLNSSSPESIGKLIINDIKNINHEIRLISHRLSPLGNKIIDNTLTEIIISDLSEFQLYRKIFIDIQLPLPKELNNINLAAQTNFYGIMLEVLNNVEKHSKANKIKITHSKENNNLAWCFSDNGIGINDKSKKGIGLQNIKQRTKLLKGKLEIKSDHNGTKIVLIFPIKQNNK